MSRLPGGALLIVIGLLVLWIAITGRLDRFAAAWKFATGAPDSTIASTDSLGVPASFGGAMLPGTYHAGQTIAALTPTIPVG